MYIVVSTTTPEIARNRHQDENVKRTGSREVPAGVPGGLSLCLCREIKRTPVPVSDDPSSMLLAGDLSMRIPPMSVACLPALWLKTRLLGNGELVVYHD